MAKTRCEMPPNFYLEIRPECARPDGRTNDAVDRGLELHTATASCRLQVAPNTRAHCGSFACLLDFYNDSNHATQKSLCVSGNSASWRSFPIQTVTKLIEFERRRS